MISVLRLCRVYGWSIEYVLDLPYKALPAINANTFRVISAERAEELRITLAAGSDEKYYKKLMNHYAESSMSESARQKSKPKAMSTEDAFKALRGL